MASPDSDKALSLLCSDCGVQLKSGKEAEEHAETTGHIKFSESLQAVTTLVCIECGKPCRSQTEKELHAKRTGHVKFEDRTAAAAAPLRLREECPRQQEEPAAATAGAPSVDVVSQHTDGAGGAKVEMVEVEVDDGLKAELEAMGFSSAKATRALHFSGGTSTEAAVNWIVDHEDDPDIEEVPKVPKPSASHGATLSSEASDSALTPEEARKKAEELREKARKKKEEEVKRLEQEREKERVRAGKEMSAAKRQLEDEERKRIMALRKVEKEEEKRARERILAKLEEDRADRRRKLGLPPEDPKDFAAREQKGREAALTAEEEKRKKKASAQSVRRATKAEQLRDCLRSLKQNHKDEGEAAVKRSFETLLKFIANVAQKPEEEKFRRIRLNNAAFQERVGRFAEGVKFLELCGFHVDDAGENLLLQPGTVDPPLLQTAGAEINSAITNPYFGIL